MYEDKWRICMWTLGLKGRYTLGNMSRRHVAATNRFVCTGEFLWKYLSPQQNSVVATCHKKWNQAEFVRLVVDFQKSPSTDLIGSFSNDLDGDSSENVKKAIGLLRKTTTVHVHDAFFVHFFKYRPCTTTTWKCLIASFMEDVNKRRRISFLSLNLSAVLKKSTPGKFAYICHFQDTQSDLSLQCVAATCCCNKSPNLYARSDLLPWVVATTCRLVCS